MKNTITLLVYTFEYVGFDSIIYSKAEIKLSDTLGDYEYTGAFM